eukprot:m.146616 g.146616  ORF g.146616 m.146616 type:complete len:292 (+) comp9698_c0_seq5:1590-2465(+)
MVGAASFWCGSSRITVTIAIIILEITGDFRFLPPIAVAVMFARLTGQFLTDGVYHMIIHLKGISILEDIPSKVMDNKFVGDLMTKPVVCVPEKAVAREIKELIAAHAFNGFPVVRSDGKRLAGLVIKSQLEALVFGPGVADDTVVDISKIMNETPVTVLKDFTMAQAFRVFRSMALRHMPVVNMDRQVVGILTRRNFMIHDHDDHAHHAEHTHPNLSRHSSDGGGGDAAVELGEVERRNSSFDEHSDSWGAQLGAKSRPPKPIITMRSPSRDSHMSVENPWMGDDASPDHH